MTVRVQSPISSTTVTRPVAVEHGKLWPWLPVIGIVGAVAVWWAITAIFANRPLVAQFSPGQALVGLGELWRSGVLLNDAAASVWRLAVGLVIATVVGFAIGLITGSSPAIDHTTRPVFGFLRMVSPLSWAPVALGVFGVGDPAVAALVAATSVWAVAVATSDGVRRVDPGLRLVARGLGATGWETFRDVTWPSIRPSVLTGIRQAVGIGWVVLVPAEMLGVTSGLGYEILNAKDQLAYNHITALILVIGTIGFAIDVVTRWLLRTPRQRRTEAEAAAQVASQS